MSSDQTKRDRRRARKAAQTSNRAHARLRKRVHTLVFAVGVIFLLFLIGRTANHKGFLRSLPGTAVPDPVQ